MKAIVCAVLSLAAIALPLTANAGEVFNREAWQQHRIMAGLYDGQLSPREFANLEHREYVLNRMREHDLARNDGHLTPQEYRHLNAVENRDSRAIYRDRHY